MFPNTDQEEDDEQRLRSSEAFRSLTKTHFSTDTKQKMGSASMHLYASWGCF